MSRTALGAGIAAAAALLAVLAGAAAAATPAAPFPADVTSEPAFVGKPAKVDPVKRGWRSPWNPFLAPNGASNLHNDAYQTDAYNRRGPEGRDTAVSSTFYTRNCGSVTFDSEGRIVTVCIGLDGPVLKLLDPDSLAEIATLVLPPRLPSSEDPFLNVSGGGYFYLDHRDRVVVPTTTRHLLVFEVLEAGFSQVADYDLSGVVPAGAGVLSVLPDWKGRMWFAGEDGTLGWVDRSDGSVHARDLGEEIANSLAVDETGGVYVVTTRALYRLAARRGRVKTVWRSRYPNSGQFKPGQLSAGSGTTPTLLGRKLVAITDNADPMHVIVYRRDRRGGGREVCRRSVFAAGSSATENSLVGFGRSLIVENNHGYTFQTSEAGAITAPGVARVDVRKGRCRLAWTSSVIAPSGVPKASLGSGLLYLYTREPSADGTRAWYFTALDLDDGRTVFRRLTGAGTFWNDHYAPISIGPDGVAYSGAVGGLIRIADGG